MSDVTLSAVIAGITGLFGALIGGNIVSINNWIQVKTQTREAKISRLIKSRETYLLPLRESLSKYMSISMKGFQAYAVLMEMQAQGVEGKDRITSFKTTMDSLDATAQIMEQIEALSWQSSDDKLHKMILDLKNKQPEVEITVRDQSKWIANIKDIPPEEWNARLSKLNSVISTQSQRLIPINKRIEDLLSGLV